MTSLNKQSKNFGTPAAIRTRDLQLRRLTLYPAELRVQKLQITPTLSLGQFPEKFQSSCWTTKPANVKIHGLNWSDF
jgi:hypothetical protein